jgi:hypothetical protein
MRCSVETRPTPEAARREDRERNQVNASIRAVDSRWELDIHVGLVNVTVMEDKLDKAVHGRPNFTLRVTTFADAVAAIRGIDPDISEEEIRSQLLARSNDAMTAALR